MNDRDAVIIDLTDCKYLGEFHKRIKDALGFPSHYGENWDAFRDSLRFDSSVEQIKIIGEHTVPDDLKIHLGIMHRVLQQCKDECARFGELFEFEIVD